MITLDYDILAYIPAICFDSGMKHVVICPGSRSIPLIRVFTEFPKFTLYYKTDERSAGFFALGLAKSDSSPVGIVVTSGSAVVNLYPAMVEAWYSHIQLVVISADRPVGMGFNNEGQTIFQNNVFGLHAYPTINFSVFSDSEINFIQNKLEFSLKYLQKKRKAPVHINCNFNEPFYNADTFIQYPEILETSKISENTAVSKTRKVVFYKKNKPKKILFMFGIGAIDYLSYHAIPQDIPALNDICSGLLINGIYLADIIWRSHSTGLIPDNIISVGNGFVSKGWSNYIKENKAIHMHLSFEDELPAYYGEVIQVNQLEKFNSFLCENYFFNQWKYAENKAAEALDRFVSEIDFCEMKAMSVLFSKIPPNYIVHTANSMPVRWAQLFIRGKNLNFSNRGVSGIDGCTSTAIGLAMHSNDEHILITGDLAFLYDINALWMEEVPKNIKIVIIDNGGGGIFSKIYDPSDNPKLLSILKASHNRDLFKIVSSLGLQVIEVKTESELHSNLAVFFTDNHLQVLIIHASDNKDIYEMYKKIVI